VVGADDDLDYVNIAPLLGVERSESAYSLLRPDGSERPAYRQLRVEGERAAARKSNPRLIDLSCINGLAQL